MRTVVVQSHRRPLPAEWMKPCCASVRGWAESKGYEYRFLGDELFREVPPALMEKTRAQPVVATDLARLQVLQETLRAGADRVVWADADVLILVPDRFHLPAADALFGREVWVQMNGSGQPRVRRKVHNAFMAFRAHEPVLPFYRFAAERILSRYRSDTPSMVPQLLGPKLLSLLHNAIGFDVLETAGVLSPAVAGDLLSGGGPALAGFRAASVEAPLAVNLCASSVESGALSDASMTRLVAMLMGDPGLLAA